MLRVDGRENNQLRECTLTLNVNKYAEGSCLVSLGHTRVYCTASVDDRVPPFLFNTQQGWVTAEYGMLPRATSDRNDREGGTRVGGRTHEIQRLIGRCLRTVTDTEALGSRTVRLDCDVLQADGGTRTASIVGAYVALAQACGWLMEKKVIKRWPLLTEAAAISVGVVTGEPVLDLCYSEDSQATVDMNVVMTAKKEFIEVQGTGEGRPFTREEHDAMLQLAWSGILTLVEKQKQALAGIGPYKK